MNCRYQLGKFRLDSSPVLARVARALSKVVLVVLLENSHGRSLRSIVASGRPVSGTSSLSGEANTWKGHYATLFGLKAFEGEMRPSLVQDVPEAQGPAETLSNGTFSRDDPAVTGEDLTGHEESFAVDGVSVNVPAIASNGSCPGGTLGTCRVVLIPATDGGRCTFVVQILVGYNVRQAPMQWWFRSAQTQKASPRMLALWRRRTEAELGCLARKDISRCPVCASCRVFPAQRRLLSFGSWRRGLPVDETEGKRTDSSIKSPTTMSVRWCACCATCRSHALAICCVSRRH